MGAERRSPVDSEEGWRRHLRASVVVLALLLLALAGCRADERPAVLHGIVVEVQAASFLRIGSFTLRTDDGSLVELIAEGDVGVTPGHLREHMALADPVSVTVRYADGLTIATKIVDRNQDADAPHP